MSAFESNPQFIQIVPPGETVIVISMQIKMQSSSGIMTICYPYLTIESIVNKLSAQNWIDKNKRMMEDEDRVKNVERLVPVSSTIKALLGQTKVSIRDLIDLELDDVLRIDQNVNSSIDVLVGNAVKFRGKPGKSGNKLAVKIDSIVRG
jgi:flagellar motor switch protein FliM